VSASGGVRTPVTTLDAKSSETGHWAPFFLPDGQHFLYFALGQPLLTPRGICVGSLNSNERKLVLRGGSNAKYAQGHVLFLRGGTLMAQGFDVRRLELTGDAAPIAEQVQVGGGSGATGAFTVSDAGVLAYEAGPSAGGSQLVWLDREGKLLGSVGVPGDYYGLRLSPDERRVAVERHDSGGAGDLWIFDLFRGTSSRFTFNGAHNIFPVWAPDGNRLAFACGAPEHYDVCVKGASGADEDQPLLTSKTRKFPTDWSPDGRYIIYQDGNANAPSDLWVLPLFGDRKPTPFLQTKFREGEGRLSPDGRWMAYTSDQNGVKEVYVRRFPATGGQWQVSTQSGEAPRWRGDGKELFYVANNGTVMAVAIHADSTVDAGGPRPLFHARISRLHCGERCALDYEVTADGQRFLVNAPIATATPITVVQNWTAGLKK
jgi:dipeptidyl aminopeptidase/acylaminoacyl peptidase